MIAVLETPMLLISEYSTLLLVFALSALATITVCMLRAHRAERRRARLAQRVRP